LSHAIERNDQAEDHSSIEYSLGLYNHPTAALPCQVLDKRRLRRTDKKPEFEVG